MLWNKMGYQVVLKEKGIKVLYRRLLIAGYTKEEASNLIASLMGLGVSEKGWTVHELAHLLYYAETHKDPTTSL